MTALTDLINSHKYLGDYYKLEGVTPVTTTQLRLAALNQIVSYYEELPPETVLQTKLNAEKEASFNAVFDGGDKVVGGLLAVKLAKGAYNYGKRFIALALSWAARGTKALARTAMRFLVRGILMPIMGAIVSVLGWPVVLALGLGSAVTYTAYKSFGRKEPIAFKPGITPEPTTAPTRGTEQARKQQEVAEGREAVPTPTGHGIQQFIESINPDLISLGKRSVYLQDSGVDIAGMNQDFMNIFYAMVGDYVLQGGGKIRINSAFRSYAKQKKLYDAWIATGRTRPYAVARPGRSRHESGVAIDVGLGPGYADVFASKGLLKKYKFIRPIRQEPWHLENLLFGNGAATQAAIKDAQQQSEYEKTKDFEVGSVGWLDKLQKSPNAIAADSYPEDARRNPDVYVDMETGKRRTFKEIYESGNVKSRQIVLNAEPRIIEPEIKEKSVVRNNVDAPAFTPIEEQPTKNIQLAKYRNMTLAVG